MNTLRCALEGQLNLLGMFGFDIISSEIDEEAQKCFILHYAMDGETKILLTYFNGEWNHEEIGGVA